MTVNSQGMITRLFGLYNKNMIYLVIMCVTLKVMDLPLILGQGPSFQSSMTTQCLLSDSPLIHHQQGKMMKLDCIYHLRERVHNKTNLETPHTHVHENCPHWPVLIFSALWLGSRRIYAHVTSQMFPTDFRPPYAFPMLFYVSDDIPMLCRVPVWVETLSIHVSDDSIIFPTLCGCFYA